MTQARNLIDAGLQILKSQFPGEITYDGVVYAGFGSYKTQNSLNQLDHGYERNKFATFVIRNADAAGVTFPSKGSVTVSGETWRIDGAHSSATHWTLELKKTV